MERISPAGFRVDGNSIENSYKKMVLSTDNQTFEITNNIHNEKGILLLKAGGKVDKNAFDNIVKHKLLKPIDESLRLKDQLTPDKLSDKFVSAFGSQAVDFDKTIDVINNIIAETNFDDIALNKLTTFSSRCSDNFDHSLATAFLSTKIGIRLNYPHKNLVGIFSAALFHDIGEMFLDLDVHNTESELTEDQFKKIKVHSIVAYTLLKASKTAFSEEMLRGVLDHHERLDGTGYPRALKGEKINEIARILGVIDTFDAMLRKGRTVEDTLWTIKLYGEQVTNKHSNSSHFDKNIYSILYSFKSSMTENQSSKTSDSPISNDHLIKLIKQLNQIWSEVSQLKNHLQSYINTSENIEDQISVQMDTVNSNLFIIENRIFDASGLAKISEQDISNDADYTKALQADINRVTPELREVFNKINRSISHVQTIDQTENFSAIATISQALHKRINDVYDSHV